MPLLLTAVATFTVPLLSVQRWDWDLGTQSDGAMMLSVMLGYAVLYPVLASAAGLLLAVTAWSKDHRGNHVYALTLPVDRWRYVMTRYRAGVMLLTVPVATLAAGAMLAGVATSLPEGLSIYPLALTLRFALAAGLAYSVFFAISAGTTRTAGYILGAGLALVGVQTILLAAGVDANFVSPLFERLLNWPGPFDVFGGRWMLVDV